MVDPVYAERARPRLFLSPDSLEALRHHVKTDPVYREVLKQVEARGEKLMAGPRVAYHLTPPRRLLLREARRCLAHVSTGAILGLLGEDAEARERYAQFAIEEMLNAADFPDWNPAHFLDTAELCCAVAMGYDWLYEKLTAAQRVKISTAIIEKGLRPGKEAYEKKAWWTASAFNWSQVCNGGLAVAALGVVDAETTAAHEGLRELAGFVLAEGLKSVPAAMASFAPDGGWAEGPGYWGYTVRYTAFYMAALQSATGSMQGLEKAEGLADTGKFRIDFTGPTDRAFNFADAGDEREGAPSMFFLSHTFNRPVYAWHHRQERLNDAFDLVWFDGRGTAGDAAALPLDYCFHGTDVGFLRSAWDDGDALWCAFKGGDNAANHSHLDLGTFVLDYGGQRFVQDLGPDDYGLPGYFQHARFTYYRLGTAGQNTLVIDGANQPHKAVAPVVSFHAGNAREGGCGVVDLSAGYPMCTSVRRGFAMPGRGQVVVQDEIEAAEGVAVCSGFHTAAEVAVDSAGRRATLTLGGKRLVAEIVEPAGAVWKQDSARQKEPENQNVGVSKLTVGLPGKVKSVRVVVRFLPEGKGGAVAVVPLREWAGKLATVGG